MGDIVFKRRNMFHSKFCLESAYSKGIKIIFNYFMFFFISIVIGMAVCLLYLVTLGVIDLYALKFHLVTLVYGLLVLPGFW